jgi:hypothetical protein
MMRALKKDICGLKAPGVLIKDVDLMIIDTCVPPSLLYASLYWVQNVERDHNVPRLCNPIYSFMLEYFPHWLKLLAITG